ncbi:MAG TPA: signal peptidase I [Nitrososphaeraceae archaeon]|nr:signal peptidase I [Nitrososphaeraceae archaeon]
MLGKENKRSLKVPIEIKCVIIVIIAVAIIWISVRAFFGVNNPFYVVASESMVPKLKVGDMLLIKYSGMGSDSSSFDNLKIGDIIVFESPGVVEDTGHREVIVHRVAEILTGLHGQRIIVTKGDANDGSIPGVDYPITVNDYRGKVVYVIPGVGLIAKTISPPVNYILIAIILVVLFFLLRKRGIEQRNEGRRQVG